MELYNPSDIKLLESNIDRMLDEIENKKMTMFGPTKDEIKQVNSIIYQFIKENKRKIYGGYALNLLIKDVNPNDAIYTEKDTPDIDFYSPEPLKDLIKLCNVLHSAGFQYVVGKEALHKETYSIYVNLQLYCDISYVPKNVYNKMPFKTIQDFYVIHPFFMTIDYLRMFSDPINSYWRIEKTLKRFSLLNKYYPLPYITKNLNVLNVLNVLNDKNDKNDKQIDLMLETVLNFLKNRKTTIAVGIYALNFYIQQSGILKSNSSKYIKLSKVPFYEFISTNFKEDTIELLELLKSSFPEKANDITVVEHYPFFQFIGHTAYIYYKDILIARSIHNYNRCLPMKNAKFQIYDEHKYAILDQSATIQIGTISVVLLFALSYVFKYRTDNETDYVNIYYTLCSHLTESRKYFFETTGLTIFDDSYFQDFALTCIGSTLPPERERRKLMDERKKKNKKFTFIYEPAYQTDEKTLGEDDIHYIFANSSGNPINNKKNLKLEDNQENDTNDFIVGDINLDESKIVSDVVQNKKEKDIKKEENDVILT